MVVIRGGLCCVEKLYPHMVVIRGKLWCVEKLCPHMVICGGLCCVENCVYIWRTLLCELCARIWRTTALTLCLHAPAVQYPEAILSVRNPVRTYGGRSTFLSLHSHLGMLTATDMSATTPTYLSSLLRWAARPPAGPPPPPPPAPPTPPPPPPWLEMKLPLSGAVTARYLVFDHVVCPP